MSGDYKVEYGLPMEAYAAIDAASSSALSKLLRSPAHMRAYMDGGYGDTPALALGRAVHTAILEPDQFEARYAKAAQCAAVTTKKGKPRCTKLGQVELASQDQVCEIHDKMVDDDRSGRELLSRADHEKCFDMHAATRAMSRASGLLTSLEATEISVEWTDPETEVRCKSRWDGYTLKFGGVIVDLKTTRDASREAFERSIFNFGYHRQGALYLESARAAGIDVEHYAIIAVESERPHGTAVYRLAEEAIAAGDQQNRMLLQAYKECLERNEWPGYPDEVQDIGIPEWAHRQIERGAA